MVRNGQARPRRLTVGAGTVTIAAPRVNDQRVLHGARQKFTSAILPPYVRRSGNVSAVLPLLYLHGLSTGDFREALPVLLGEDAAGLSPAAITRLTATWRIEYDQWRRRSLADRDFIYVWVDGVHVNIRLEDDRLAALVVVGGRPDGTKEVIAIEDGYRESTESWLAGAAGSQDPRHASPGRGDRRRGAGLRSARSGRRRGSNAAGYTALPTCWISSRRGSSPRRNGLCTR